MNLILEKSALAQLIQPQVLHVMISIYPPSYVDASSSRSSHSIQLSFRGRLHERCSVYVLLQDAASNMSSNAPDEVPHGQTFTSADRIRQLSEIDQVCNLPLRWDKSAEIGFFRT